MYIHTPDVDSRGVFLSKQYPVDMSKLPIDFPRVVKPIEMSHKRSYLLVLKTSGRHNVIGPFQLNSTPEIVTNKHPFNGHMSLETILDDGVTGHIIVPREGIAVICGIQYSLHDATKETSAYFSRACMKNDRWVRHQLCTFNRRHNKYVD